MRGSVEDGRFGPTLKIRERLYSMGGPAGDGPTSGRRPTMSDGLATIRPCVVWFTGLSGAGKSTLALGLYEQLIRDGVAAEYLDGDVVRRLLSGTGFSRAERDAHVARVGFLASRLEHHGIITICALIS